MNIENNCTVLFAGDSITDAGRARPVGEGPAGDLGGGFVNLVFGYLNAFHPEKRIRVLNTGNSGDTTNELLERWQRDVLGLKPDYVNLMIGINDCWRPFKRLIADEMKVDVEKYARNLEKLVDQTLLQVKGMTLMTPYFIHPSRDDTMRAAMDEYRAAMKQVAAQKGVPCFDTQEKFDAALRHLHPYMFAGDCVHPYAGGHLMLARTWLEGVNLW